MINWKVRIKNKTFWLTLIPAVLLLAQVVVAVSYTHLDVYKRQLQNQITEVDERLAALEHMTLKNLFTVPVAIDNTRCV